MDTISVLDPPTLQPAHTLNLTHDKEHDKEHDIVQVQVQELPTRTFHSRLLKAPIPKPWLESRDPRERWAVIIPYIGIGIAFLGMLAIASLGYFQTPHHKFCLILDEQFSTPTLDPKTWETEVQLGGFGTGTFDWTTSNERNLFIKDGALHLYPTLTNESGITNGEIYNGYTVNLTASGECTSINPGDCTATSNITTGAIIPPIQSARITTRNSYAIRYGKVQVVAKLPKGDWLWPAIWMLPVNETYGPWPASGEIDILESRGNGRAYWPGGNNIASSALHWGPVPAFDGYSITNGGNAQPLGDYAAGYHTFGMEWTPDYLFTWIDTPLRQVMYFKFPTSLWKLGNFPTSFGLDPLYDLWKSKTKPFDQAFYLVLNNAVGGTNGYFRDDVGGKPWVNGDRVAAKYHFYRGIEGWWDTWREDKQRDRGLSVKSVKMWQMC